MEEEEVEYGILYSGGILVWPNDPEIEEIYPLEDRIRHQIRNGCKVVKRKVIVVEDWEEVDGV